MSKPRVLQVITHLSQGGAERVCFTLMRALRNEFDFGLLAVRGIETSDVGRAFEDELRDLGIPLFTATKLSIKHGGMAVAGWKMARICSRFRPDLIHLHTEIPESTYAAMTVLPTRWRRVPLLRSIHNTVLWTPWRKMGRWCEQHMTASHIAAVSSAALDSYRVFRAETNPQPLPSEPRIIFNGVPAPATLRERGNFAEPIRIVFAGRLELQKAADLLPQIVRETHLPAGRSIELTIFGDGAFRESSAALAASPPAGWSIRLLPPASDLRDRFANFDLAIMPSRYEGFGLLAVEALMAGLPVIATHAPGLVEVFPDSYPWLAIPGDASSFAERLSLALQSSVQERDQMMREAMSFVASHFSVDAMARGYAELFNAALKRQV